MTTDPEAARDEEMRRAWQEQPTDAHEVRVDAIRARAEKLERAVRRRDLREYAAGALVAGGCLVATLGPGPARPFAIATLIGLVLVLGRLWRHARSAPPAPALDAPTAEHLGYLRVRLSREGALLASAGSWYLAPLVPGMVILFAGIARAAPPGARAMPAFWVGLGVPAVIVIITFVVIQQVNARAARALEDEIRELEP
jgi:hypothetical protein